MSIRLEALIERWPDEYVLYVLSLPGFSVRAADAGELQALVRDNLAPYEYPKEFEYVAELPMTTTGKVQRRVLRLQEEERARNGGRSS